MKAQTLLFLFAFIALVTGTEPARALATATVFSQPGQLNESDTGALSAVASGTFTNEDIDGSLSASANLQAGALRLYVSASPNDFLTSNAASTSALFSDTVTIAGPGTSSIPVTFTFDVDARLFAEAPANGSARLIFSAELSFTGLPGRPGPGFSIQRFIGLGEDTITCGGNCNLFNVPLTTEGTVDATLVHTVFVAPNTPFGIQAVLRGTALGSEGSSLNIDASHTGLLHAELPAGYSFSSASGGFLTAVPLPATGGLLAAAVGVLGLLRRRR